MESGARPTRSRFRDFWTHDSPPSVFCNANRNPTEGRARWRADALSGARWASLFLLSVAGIVHQPRSRSTSCQHIVFTSPTRWPVMRRSFHNAAISAGSASHVAHSARISASVSTRSRCCSTPGFSTCVSGLNFDNLSRDGKPEQRMQHRRTRFAMMGARFAMSSITSCASRRVMSRAGRSRVSLKLHRF
jgi:hypothetical protein